MSFENYHFTCVERFLKYVQYDTTSDDNSSTFPSTAKQFELAKELVRELKEIGLADAYMDEYGYVIASLPSNTSKQNVPTIGFIAHIDTSPAVSGSNVKPIVHRNYKGGDIVLPGDPTKVITVEENPALKKMIGHDIITSDGTTLLGADNKAGVAEIIDAMNYLIAHPEIKHGEIKICFTPDEEIGRGTEKFDVKKFGAKYAYTIDGSEPGEIEIETFNADSMVFKFKGKNIHPGYAKNRMINSIKIASKFIELLPKDCMSPETTEKREGFVHPVSISGNEELTQVKFIIRDFEEHKLKQYEEYLIGLAQKAIDTFPGSSFEFEIVHQYRNMIYELNKHPQVKDFAIEAMKRLNITPIEKPIRGGTDGARLTYMGLPTPNIFAGERNFHSQLEWISAEDMKLAVKLIVEIAKIWEGKS